MNIPQILECSSPVPATLCILLSFSHLITYFNLKFCCITSFDEIFGHELSLRTLRIAKLRREEFLRDEDELVVPYSKKFHQVALTDRVP